MRNRTTILILGTAQFVMVLDTTVMNVSVSQVVEDLNTTVPAVQLGITAYALVMAAFMLTGAKLADMRGRRRIFSVGLGVYGTGSLITALSPISRCCWSVGRSSRAPAPSSSFPRSRP
jgi:MFS family permease